MVPAIYQRNVGGRRAFRHQAATAAKILVNRATSDWGRSMTKIDIDATTDWLNPNGGNIMLLLRGQTALPSNFRFRIEPIAMGEAAESHTDGRKGWPIGEHEPIEVEVLPEGVQIVLERDTVPASWLQPGTLLKFVAKQGDLHGEFAWPAIVSLALHTAPLAPAPVHSEPEPTAPEPLRIEPVKVEQAKVVDLSATPQRDDSPRPMVAKDDSPVLSSLNTNSKASGQLNGTPMELPVPPKLDGPTLKLDSAEAQLSAIKLDEKPRSPMPIVLARAEQPIVAKMVRVEDEVKPVAPRRSLGFMRSLSMLLIGAVAGAGGTLFWFGGGPTSLGGQGMEAVRNIYPIFGDAFKAGPVSPRGRAASSVDLDTALKLAEANLLGIGQQADRVEARYWLAKSLDYAVGDNRMVWALTQLGSLYAKPESNQPDYVTARALWSIAAGQGDPISMCFLAKLHENGLGTPVDTKAALVLYERALSNGGCSDAQAGLQRLRK
jgi:Sel1 repeat